MLLLTADNNHAYGVIDAQNGEQVSYELVTTYATGVPMTDALCDGVLYRKLPDGRYLRRVVADGVINAEWYGVKGDNSTDNAPLLNSLITKLPANRGWTISLPPGILVCQSTVVLQGKSIYLKGNRGASMLLFPPGVQGIYMRRADGGDMHKLSDLFISAASQAADGYVNGTKSPNGIDYAYNGVNMDSISIVENCVIRNFSGNGIIVSANVGQVTPATPYGTDASRAQFYNTSCGQCGANGFYFVGGDANQCTINSCDARDNALWGFHDASFLGNQFIACHGNNNYAGHYNASDPNNYATFLACYGEGGSPSSQAGGISTVVGGIHPNGWITSSFSSVQQGNRFSGMYFGGLSLGTDALTFAGSQYSSKLIWRNVNPAGNTNWRLADSEHQGDAGVLEIFQANESAQGRRAQALAGCAVQWAYIGDVLHLSMNTHGRNFSFNQDMPALLNYRPGDVITFADREQAYCARLICTVAGVGNQAQWKADGQGRGATAERPSASNANFSLFGPFYVGWGYWNTDTNTLQHWTGSAWV